VGNIKREKRRISETRNQESGKTGKESCSEGAGKEGSGEDRHEEGRREESPGEEGRGKKSARQESGCQTLEVDVWVMTFRARAERLNSLVPSSLQRLSAIVTEDPSSVSEAPSCALKTFQIVPSCPPHSGWIPQAFRNSQSRRRLSARLAMP